MSHIVDKPQTADQNWCPSYLRIDYEYPDGNIETFVERQLHDWRYAGHDTWYCTRCRRIEPPA